MRLFAPPVLTGPAGPGPPGFQQLPSRVAGHKLPVCTEIMSSMVWGVKTSLLLMNGGENARWQLVFHFLILQNKDVPLCWLVLHTAGGAQGRAPRGVCRGEEESAGRRHHRVPGQAWESENRERHLQSRGRRGRACRRGERAHEGAAALSGAVVFQPKDSGHLDLCPGR